MSRSNVAKPHGLRAARCAPPTQGKAVELCGWVNRRRDHGGLIFVDLRDRDGITQIVFDPQASAASPMPSACATRTCCACAAPCARRPQGTENAETADRRSRNRRGRARGAQPLRGAAVPGQRRRRRRRKPSPRVSLSRSAPPAHAAQHRARAIASSRRCATSSTRATFIEIETPMLIKSTPEGARDYLVPSRIHPGTFYALPQSPQTAQADPDDRRLRTLHADRALHARRGFARRPAARVHASRRRDVVLHARRRAGNDGIVHARTCGRRVLGVELRPFPRFSHAEALQRFGTDKPDLRFGLELVDVTGIFAGTDFVVFKSVIESRGAIVALRYPGGGVAVAPRLRRAHRNWPSSSAPRAWCGSRSARTA